MSLSKFFILLFFSISLYATSNYSPIVKEKKIYPMGKKIYTQKCSSIDPNNYSSYDELYNSLEQSKICSKLSAKHLEALTLYLWEVKRSSEVKKQFEKLQPAKEDKCPVCGMFVYKYPRWAAKIEYGDKYYFFDGIKDMMKYYFEHQKGISHLLVQDYYTEKTLDGLKVYFVYGSDVYGPMGNEFLAFETKEAAKRFLLDHKGKAVISFEEITEDLVYSLDD